MSDTEDILEDITDKTNHCCDNWGSRPPSSFLIVALALQIGLLQEIKEILESVSERLPWP